MAAVAASTPRLQLADAERRRRLNTCHHEAGHAVAAHIYGRYVEHVSVEGGDGFARVTISHAERLEPALKDLIIMLAGEAAARLEIARNGQCWASYSTANESSDEQVARETAERVTESAAEAAALLEFARQKTSTLASTSRFQVAVLHLAAILDTAGALDAETLRVEFQRVDLRIERGQLTVLKQHPWREGWNAPRDFMLSRGRATLAAGAEDPPGGMGRSS